MRSVGSCFPLTPILEASPDWDQLGTALFRIFHHKLRANGALVPSS